MWRSHTVRRGRQILGKARRQLSGEAAKPSAQPPPPPPPPAQPPKKSGGFGLVKFFGLGLPLAAGGVVGYAWYDPDFRQQLEDNVPYAKDVLDNVLPSDSNVQSKHSQEPVKTVPPALEKATMLNVQDNAPTVIAPLPAPVIEPPSSDYSDECQDEPVNSHFQELLSNEPALEPTKATGLAREKQKPASSKKDEVEMQLRAKAEDEKADNAALEVVINKLVDSSQYLTAEAAKAQLVVANSTKDHTKLLKKAMDDTSDILQKDAQWEDVAIAFKEREEALNRANDLVSEARKSLEKLKAVLEEGKKTKTTQKNAAIYSANKKLTEMTKDLTSASFKVRQADADAKVMLKYKDLVDKGRRQFQMELESLVPEVKLGNKSRKLTEDELNSLIAHAHRRIEQLQKQIAEQLSMERKRLETSLENQQEEDKKLTESAVQDEKSRLEKEFELEKQKMELDFLVYQEEEVRKQLARQAGAHSDHLKDVLAVQHDQLSSDFDRQLNMKLLEEREKFQTEVAGWMARLKGIESAVDARAASEKLARTAQDLWLACIALNSAISFSDEESKLLPLKEKVEAVVKSSNKNPFVENIAAAIPSTALDRGVQTEKELRDRFVKVSTVCRRLGLITEANASLYKYVISFLHSFLKFDSVVAFSENDVVNLSELDNCKMVAIAQYWLERDNLEMALKFMNQLTGESRKAASDWITEATLLLETRQVAHALSAYASATGLAATF